MPLDISEHVIASASVLIMPAFVKTEYVLNIRAIALIKLANMPKIKKVCSLLKGPCIYKLTYKKKAPHFRVEPLNNQDYKTMTKTA